MAKRITKRGRIWVAALLSISTAGCDGADDLATGIPAEAERAGPPAFSAAAGTGLCAPPAASLLSWWPGDGDFSDAASGRNGTAVGSVRFATAVVGKAFGFNGSSYVSVGDDPVWTLGTDDFTIAAWVNFNSVVGNLPVAGHDEGPGFLNKWIFWRDQGALRFHVNSPSLGPQDVVVAPWSPAAGRWYHVAVSRSGNTFRLHIDGSEVATATSSISIPDPAFPLTIGRAEGAFLNGWIDEPAIHKRALTQAEIATMYAAGSSGTCQGSGSGPCLARPSNLFAWWPAEGNFDEVVAGRNGSSVNGVAFAPGKVGQAFSFNGTNHVSVADEPVWTLGSRAFTIELWVKLNRPAQGRDAFIAHDEGPGELNKWIFWQDVRGHQGFSPGPPGPALRFHINSPTMDPQDPVQAPWVPVTGRWYHVAVTRSGSTYVLYIDGVRVADSTNSMPIPDPAFPLTIGNAEGGNFLDGQVDDGRIYLDRALSDAEIKAIYDAGVFGMCLQPPPNQPPVAKPGGPYSGAEGSSVSFDGSGSFDPDGDALSFTWDFGDGTPPGSGAKPSHAYQDNGSYTVTLTVQDPFGATATATASVTVANLAPTASFANDGPVGEGAAFTLSLGGATDPSAVDLAAGLQFAFDCGDGSGYGALGTATSATCPTTDDATRNVRGKVRDKDGGETEYTATVVVNNVAPLVSAIPGATLIKNETYTASGSFSDPGADTWAATVDYGDGSGPQPLALVGTSFQLSHKYKTPGTYVVTVTVTDDDGGSGTASATVEVLKPGKAIQQLSAAVDALVASGQLAAPLAGGLKGKLAAAEAQAELGNNAAAKALLQAFIKQVEGFVKAGKLSAAAAQGLIDQAQRILATL
ncbi:MAG: PKD domain-containing protein [Gemmatimonadetes bacterium]|nr:PKD domain-containing protein [Gemmatimonadota bacterium]